MKMNKKKLNKKLLITMYFSRFAVPSETDSIYCLMENIFI